MLVCWCDAVVAALTDLTDADALQTLSPAPDTPGAMADTAAVEAEVAVPTTQERYTRVSPSGGHDQRKALRITLRLCLPFFFFYHNVASTPG